MSYWQVLRAEPRFLAFGFLMAFFSSFGQTFFIALFSAELRADFGLSHGGFGSVYSLATLTSAALMVWVGRLIDKVDLRLYAALVCAGIAAACLVMAAAPTGSLAFLFLAIFLLRFTGQGLMSHVSATSMARYFEAMRGRATAIASFGVTSGEILLPSLTVAMLAAIGWRSVWGLYGGLLALGLVPLMLWLLRGHGARHDALLARLDATHEAATLRRHWTRSEVLRDPFFYLVLPLILAQSFIVTGVFFHQVHLVDSKGWTMELFAATYLPYGVCTLVALLGVGLLVDRFGALRLLPLVKLPLALGLLVLAGLEARWSAFLYMSLAGLTAGSFGVFVGAFWAEVYGLRHLGAIRALASALMVLGSAGSPALLGWMIDATVSVERIAFACFLYLAMATALAVVALRRRARAAQPLRETA